LTEIEIKTLQGTINSAAAQLTQRKVEAANAKQYLDRIVPLRAHDFVTDNDLVRGAHKLKVAEACCCERERGDFAKHKTPLGDGWRLQSNGCALRRKASKIAQLNSDYCSRPRAVRLLCH